MSRAEMMAAEIPEADELLRGVQEAVTGYNTYDIVLVLCTFAADIALTFRRRPDGAPITRAEAKELLAETIDAALESGHDRRH